MAIDIDRLLVPPPAVLDLTRPQNAGISPFCLDLMSAEQLRDWGRRLADAALREAAGR
jgi:hypothetical protein